MDALSALSAARSWSSALDLLRSARPHDEPAAVAADLRAVAVSLLCWDEVALLLDASYSLRCLQEARDRSARGQQTALEALQGAARGEIAPPTNDALNDPPAAPASFGPDLVSQRARAVADLGKTAAAVALAEVKIRDEIEKRKDRLIRRIDFIAGTRDIDRINEEIATRLGQLGDLERFHSFALLISRRKALASSEARSIVLSAASELSEAHARAARAATLRDLASSPSEALAADEAHARALAEVRAIETRDKGGTSEALAQAEAAANALQSAGRLPV